MDLLDWLAVRGWSDVEEVTTANEKISFALEMGSNTMLYLDDIQHTNPELLQKFISLCDGQRRMEGVWNGGSVRTSSDCAAEAM